MELRRSMPMSTSSSALLLLLPMLLPMLLLMSVPKLIIGLAKSAMMAAGYGWPQSARKP